MRTTSRRSRRRRWPRDRDLHRRAASAARRDGPLRDRRDRRHRGRCRRAPARQHRQRGRLGLARAAAAARLPARRVADAGGAAGVGPLRGQRAAPAPARAGPALRPPRRHLGRRRPPRRPARRRDRDARLRVARRRPRRRPPDRRRPRPRGRASRRPARAAAVLPRRLYGARPMIAAVVGSVTPPGRLRRAVAEALDRAAAPATLIDLAEHPLPFAGTGTPDAPALDAIAEADAVLLATPVYRGTYTGALKNLLDLLPVEALQCKAVSIVAMGATDHHSLGADWHLRDVLAWFGAVVAPTGVYLTSRDFEAGGPPRGRRGGPRDPLPR